MDLFEKAAQKIIQEQKLVIGPLALEQAQQVSGLKVSDDSRKVTMTGNKAEVLNKLVSQYSNLFGKTSIEVCKEAIGSLLTQFPAQQVPSLLR